MNMQEFIEKNLKSLSPLVEQVGNGIYKVEYDKNNTRVFYILAYKLTKVGSTRNDLKTQADTEKEDPTKETYRSLLNKYRKNSLLMGVSDNEIIVLSRIFDIDPSSNATLLKVFPNELELAEKQGLHYYDNAAKNGTITELIFKPELFPVIIRLMDKLLPFPRHKDIVNVSYSKKITSSEPRNLIYFGAPGTGKSHRLEKEMYDKEQKTGLLTDCPENYERVTFHPDYSYANFVGSYRPVEDHNDDGEKIITYRFVAGPFMRILAKAIKNLNTEGADPMPYLLIIEEINRANPAAVFGEVFQLLDRDSNNNFASKYSINPSEEVMDYLSEETGFDRDSFKELRIPSNMFIWATMNSADQGVYPMDTAFKRRWDFEYIGINDGENKVNTEVHFDLAKKTQAVKWNALRKAINNKLSNNCGINEDKLMGPFFISNDALLESTKSKEGASRYTRLFKSKVIMYLFEDAARQRDKRSTVFEGFSETKGSPMTLSALFNKFDEIGIGLFFGESDFEAFKNNKENGFSEEDINSDAEPADSDDTPQTDETDNPENEEE